MADKSPPNSHHRRHKCWLPPQGQGPLRDFNHNLAVAPFPSIAEPRVGLALLDDFSALRQILESDNYRVALVPRGTWDHIRGAQVEPTSTVVPAVLLPFSWKELVARVCESECDSNTLTEDRVAGFEDVFVDFTTMVVSRSSGETITLTAQQFKVLRCFLSNPNRVFSRAELLKEAWGYENYPSTRTVDNQVLKLRQKLERDSARPVHFQTVHRFGYKFVP
jgi:transcriptional regulator